MARAHALRSPAGRARPRARRPAPRARTIRRVSWRRRIKLGALLAVVVSAGYFFWLRDSSLVAVNRLSVSGVSGVSGADSTRIKAALAEAARDMTTLHIRHDDLARAVRPFPIVKSVSASPSYPNTLSVEVELLKPALVVEAPGRTVTVADDGTMLRGVAPVRGLPRLHVSRAPAGTRLSGEALEQALVLGAMPTQLRPYVLGASMLASGVEVRMKNGPEIRFGDGTGARVKWAAATRVLADKRVGSVAYVDVSAPERPAVGGIMQGIVGESAPVAPSSTVVPSQ